MLALQLRVAIAKTEEDSIPAADVARLIVQAATVDQPQVRTKIAPGATADRYLASLTAHVACQFASHIMVLADAIVGKCCCCCAGTVAPASSAGVRTA